jgi:hypothetical protein
MNEFFWIVQFIALFLAFLGGYHCCRRTFYKIVRQEVGTKKANEIFGIWDDGVVD